MLVPQDAGTDVPAVVTNLKVAIVNWIDSSERNVIR
jgi:hypothetical protein